jgi:opacity protein-like surface antigen
MTKRLLLAAALLAISTPALAEGPYYAGGHLGLTFVHDSTISAPGYTSATYSFKTGFAIGGHVGYRYNPNVRFEGEISYKTADVDVSGGGSFSALGFMANGYYDFTGVQLPVTPFVGLGLGMIRGTTSGGGSSSRSDTEFGYQLSLGASYPINKNASVTGMYRFQGSSDFKIEGVTATYKSSSLLVGLNYVF